MELKTNATVRALVLSVPSKRAYVKAVAIFAVANFPKACEKRL